MKYCIHYYAGCSFINEVQEIMIKYTGQDIKTILKFFREHPEQRIIFDVAAGVQVDYEIFEIISEGYPQYDFAVRFADRVRETPKWSFFYAEYISTWDRFDEQVRMGVSDIYVTEELGFDLAAAARVAKRNGVKIRVLPNYAQSGSPTTDPAKKFFIRPEDESVYEGIVDVYEILQQGNTAEVVYKVYAKDKQWYGDLNEIIPTLKENVDNRRIPSKMFAIPRVDCKKSCLAGGHCNMCREIFNLSKTLEDKNYIFE